MPECPRCRFYVQVDWICKHWPTSWDQFSCMLYKGNLNPTVAFAIQLGVTVSEHPNQPTLHRLYIAQPRARSIGLKKCFLLNSSASAREPVDQ